jgi:putative redox protein
MMAGVRVRWIDGQRFEAADEVGHTVMTDPEGQGFKPPDLLLAAVVCCAGADVVGILKKKRQQISSIEASVTKQNAPEPPWRIEKIEVEWTVRGRNLKEKAVRDAIWLAEEKYCSVRASMNSEMVTVVHLVNEGEEGD